MTLLNFRMSRS